MIDGYTTDDDEFSNLTTTRALGLYVEILKDGITGLNKPDAPKNTPTGIQTSLTDTQQTLIRRVLFSKDSGCIGSVNAISSLQQFFYCRSQ